MRINKLISSLALCLILAIASFATSFEFRSVTPDQAAAIQSVDAVDVSAVSIINTNFQLVRAVYSAAEVDAGDLAPAARTERPAVVTLPANYLPDIQYADLYCWPTARDVSRPGHNEPANGFSGLGADHYARADV